MQLNNYSLQFQSSLLVLQEYSSLVLSILSHKRELRRFMVITCCNDFEYFLLRLSSKDPDIQYNSLKVVYFYSFILIKIIPIFTIYLPSEWAKLFLSW